MATIYGEMDRPHLSLTKTYRLRCGPHVTGLLYYVEEKGRTDGFPWKAIYTDSDGIEKIVWVNHYGQWSNNDFVKSDLDLIEVPFADHGEGS